MKKNLCKKTNNNCLSKIIFCNQKIKNKYIFSKKIFVLKKNNICKQTWIKPEKKKNKRNRKLSIGFSKKLV